jgi:surfeit locus 1 family protein
VRSSSSLARWLPLRALVSRRWLPSTLAVLAGMIVLVRLGVWQLDRLELRQERNALLVQQLSAAPLDLNAGSLPADLSRVTNHRAMARGEFDFAHQVALTLQNWEGQPGVHLLAPLLLEGRQEAVLVDRGWIPFEESAPEEWSRFDEPGPQTVTGYLQPSEPPPRPARDAAAAGPLREWYRVDVEAIQGQMPYPLLPVYLLQTPLEDDQARAGLSLPYRVRPEVDLSEGRHLGYAVQFFLFALILGAGYARIVAKKTYESEES